MVDPLGTMPIGPYGPGSAESVAPGQRGPVDPSAPGGSFADLLKQSVYEVNHLQQSADQKIQKLVTGEIGSIHEVMVATEEAGVAFNLLLQIRNQLLRTWNELKRTPV